MLLTGSALSMTYTRQTNITKHGQNVSLDTNFQLAADDWLRMYTYGSIKISSQSAVFVLLFNMLTNTELFLRACTIYLLIAIIFFNIWPRY